VPATAQATRRECGHSNPLSVTITIQTNDNNHTSLTCPGCPYPLPHSATFFFCLASYPKVASTAATCPNANGINLSICGLQRDTAYETHEACSQATKRGFCAKQWLITPAGNSLTCKVACIPSGQVRKPPDGWHSLGRSWKPHLLQADTAVSSSSGFFIFRRWRTSSLVYRLCAARVLKCSCFAGKALFADALLDGTLQGFFKLIEQFRYTTFGYKQLVTYFMYQTRHLMLQYCDLASIPGHSCTVL